MSAYRKTQSDGDFEMYRQMAPESFSDQSLQDLIKSNNYKREAIITAIENIWHDTSDQQAVGSEWIVASKVGKKEPLKVSSHSSVRRGDMGGRVAPKSKDARETTARGADKSKLEKARVSTPKSDTVTVHTSGFGVGSESLDSCSSISATTSKSAWGNAGLSFAEKIKLQESEKQIVQLHDKKASLIESEVTQIELESTALNRKLATPRGRNRKTKSTTKKVVDEGDNDNLDLVSVLQDSLNVNLNNISTLVDGPVALSNIPTSDDVDTSFLKWNASTNLPSSGEMFQFGSFGNFSSPTSNDELTNKPNDGSNWTPVTVQESVKNESSNSAEWNESSVEISSDVLKTSPAGLSYEVKTQLDISGSRAPPGLEQSKGGTKDVPSVSLSTLRSNQTKVSAANKESVSYQMMHTQPNYQHQQYSQAGATANRTNISQSGLPYAAYSPSFDSSSPSYVHPGFPQGTGLASIPNGPVSGTQPSTTVLPLSTNSNSQSSVPQQNYATPAFPFYGNPYYNQAAYYYAQPSNYFGQQNNRSLYQQQSQYGTDPYVASGAIYQQNQTPFPDSNYGGNPPNTSVSVVNGAPALGVGKLPVKGHSASVINSSGNVSQSGVTTDPNSASSYGYVNPYGRGIDAQAWQYQQNPAAWNTPMMNFPNGTSQNSGLHGSFQNQSSHATQRSGNQNSTVSSRNGSNSSAFGLSTFGGGRNNSNNTGTPPQAW